MILHYRNPLKSVYGDVYARYANIIDKWSLSFKICFWIFDVVYLMLYICVARFDKMRNFKKILDFRVYDVMEQRQASS